MTNPININDTLQSLIKETETRHAAMNDRLTLLGNTLDDETKETAEQNLKALNAQLVEQRQLFRAFNELSIETATQEVIDRITLLIEQYQLALDQTQIPLAEESKRAQSRAIRRLIENKFDDFMDLIDRQEMQVSLGLVSLTHYKQLKSVREFCSEMKTQITNYQNYFDEKIKNKTQLSQKEEETIKNLNESQERLSTLIHTIDNAKTPTEIAYFSDKSAVVNRKDVQKTIENFLNSSNKDKKTSSFNEALQPDGELISDKRTTTVFGEDQARVNHLQFNERDREYHLISVQTKERDVATQIEVYKAEVFCSKVPLTSHRISGFGYTLPDQRYIKAALVLLADFLAGKPPMQNQDILAKAPLEKIRISGVMTKEIVEALRILSDCKIPLLSKLPSFELEYSRDIYPNIEPKNRQRVAMEKLLANHHEYFFNSFSVEHKESLGYREKEMQQLEKKIKPSSDHQPH